MGQARLARRQTQSKPILERFFAWIDEQCDKRGFLPSSPFLGALAYIRERRVGHSVYLDDPEVLIDTNHLERAPRVILIGQPAVLEHIALGCAVEASQHELPDTQVGGKDPPFQNQVESPNNVANKRRNKPKRINMPNASYFCADVLM